MTVSLLQDIVNHYLQNFSAYPLALAIILLNVAYDVYFCLRSRYRPLYPKHGRLDLLVSLLYGMLLTMGLMLQGVLADNNAPGIYHWSSYLWVVYLVSLVLFIAQIVLHIKTPSMRPRMEPTDEIPTLQTAPQEQFQPQAPLEQPAVSQEDPTPRDRERRQAFPVRSELTL